MTILVVEDNLKLNHNIVDILSFEGYDVLSALSIEEAKSLYLEASPSIVLLDIMLPDGNSYHELSAFRRDKRTYIIMLTALDAREIKRICYENGADDYITKPFALDELVMKIRAVSWRISLNNPVLYIGDIKINKSKQTIEAKRVETLTPALFQVFEILCDNYMKAPKSPDYYEIEDYDKSRVQTAINRLRNHLYDAGSKRVSIRNIYKKGYVLEVDDE